MATYVNNLRLKEIATGDESGTWGTSTNTNLELITDAFSYGVQEMAGDANETFTMLDATADDVRSFYLKITSAVSLTATREITLGPNTVSKVWMIENATSGSQIITIKQGSGATVNVPNGSKVMVVTDGAGVGAAVLNANPVVDLTSDVTGNLPLANGGTGASLVDPNADRIFFWDDSAGSTAFLTVGSGLELSGTTLSSTDAGGTVTSVAVSGGTTGLTTSGGPVTTSGTITLAGTLAVANGGTNATTAAGARASISANALPILKGTSYSANVGEFIVASAGGITITLPATPSAGDTVTVKDGTGAAATTTFTVARNGSNIAASATDLIFDKNYAEITMTYIDGTIGWSV